MAELPRVWFERPILPDLLEEVEHAVQILGPGTPGAPLHGIEQAEGIVAGALHYDEHVMDKAPGLRVIARTGIGVDRVDIAEASRRGIAVCNAPDAPTVSTAEHTIALVLAVAKNLKGSEARLRSGEHGLYARHDALELAGKQLGLVGYGRIARHVAKIAEGLGMTIRAFDPLVDPRPSDVDLVATLDELLATSDVVSLHIPLTPETRHSFGRAQFAAMKSDAIFVNTARGGLVDHQALLAALEAGSLFGAGLDVTEPEPINPDHPLLYRDEVVVTAHVASGTRTGKRRLFRTALEQVLLVLAGEVPTYVVNPDDWSSPRKGTS